MTIVVNSVNFRLSAGVHICTFWRNLFHSKSLTVISGLRRVRGAPDTIE